MLTGIGSKLNSQRCDNSMANPNAVDAVNDAIEALRRTDALTRKRVETSNRVIAELLEMHRNSIAALDRSREALRRHSPPATWP